ncbi:hypothetical protein [Vibrio diabolicus]|uniref:hypothetical protein n=1 Tax=Vibrio diabolicus TaxID=50719 RepID=UPI0021515F48|nr:hypothetical protein [Vibrio diabolicus]MCE9831613.1 hypothetical protein [Vibrio diabolicus]
MNKLVDKHSTVISQRFEIQRELEANIMKNKTQPYLAGRFFDSISSGLFMMALP